MGHVTVCLTCCLQHGYKSVLLRPEKGYPRFIGRLKGLMAKEHRSAAFRLALPVLLRYPQAFPPASFSRAV